LSSALLRYHIFSPSPPPPFRHPPSFPSCANTALFSSLDATSADRSMGADHFFIIDLPTVSLFFFSRRFSVIIKFFLNCFPPFPRWRVFPPENDLCRTFQNLCSLRVFTTEFSQRSIVLDRLDSSFTPLNLSGRSTFFFPDFW